MEIINITCLRQKSQRHRPKWVGKLPESWAEKWQLKYCPWVETAEGSWCLQTDRDGCFLLRGGRKPESCCNRQQMGEQRLPFHLWQQTCLGISCPLPQDENSIPYSAQKPQPQGWKPWANDRKELLSWWQTAANGKRKRYWQLCPAG